jgi:hypothetical protein
MKTYTKNELIERLIECDYPNDDKLLGEVVEKIQNLGPEAKKIFDLWFTTGRLTDFNIQDITPAYLRKFHKMKEAGIIIAYDWLFKDEKNAVRLLKKPVILNIKK